MKIVNAVSGVSTAVANVNANDVNEMNTKMMIMKTNTLPEYLGCLKLQPMDRNLRRTLYATESDVESASRNLLMLLVGSRYFLDDHSMQRNLRFSQSEFFLCGGSNRVCASGKHSVLHTWVMSILV